MKPTNRNPLRVQKFLRSAVGCLLLLGMGLSAQAQNAGNGSQEREVQALQAELVDSKYTYRYCPSDKQKFYQHPGVAIGGAAVLMTGCAMTLGVGCMVPALIYGYQEVRVIAPQKEGSQLALLNCEAASAQYPDIELRPMWARVCREIAGFANAERKLNRHQDRVPVSSIVTDVDAPLFSWKTSGQQILDLGPMKSTQRKLRDIGYKSCLSEADVARDLLSEPELTLRKATNAYMASLRRHGQWVFVFDIPELHAVFASRLAALKVENRNYANLKKLALDYKDLRRRGLVPEIIDYEYAKRKYSEADFRTLTDMGFMSVETGYFINFAQGWNRNLLDMMADYYLGLESQLDSLRLAASRYLANANDIQARDLLKRHMDHRFVSSGERPEDFKEKKIRRYAELIQENPSATWLEVRRVF